MTSIRAISLNTFDPMECPGCGSNKLHFNFVREFYRVGGEDGQSKKIDYRPSGKSEGVECTDNPSSRRDAVRLYFQCEGCDRGAMLTFIQHKGCTFVEENVADVNQDWTDVEEKHSKHQ
jgi:hypothetical protein